MGDTERWAAWATGFTAGASFGVAMCLLGMLIGTWR